jgi:hypothetical protein
MGFCRRPAALSCMVKGIPYERRRWPRASSLIEKETIRFRKKSEIPLKRHSGEGRNPAISVYSGCRIKSGMTNSGPFARPSKFGNEVSYGVLTMDHKPHFQYWRRDFVFNIITKHAKGGSSCEKTSNLRPMTV